MLLAGAGLIAYAVTSSKSKPEGFGTPSSFTAPTAAPIVPTPVPTAQPTPEPTPEPSRANVQRMMIQKVGIDAPIGQYGVTSSGEMDVPPFTTAGAAEVAWYNPDRPNAWKHTDNLLFSNHPGWPGNTIFSGHVYVDKVGRGVFYRLKELVAGDEIDLKLDDGTMLSYKVISGKSYSADADPIAAGILDPQENEVITLITCSGDVIPGTLELASRWVIQAQRVLTPS